MNSMYILKGHEPVPTDDVELFGRWFENFKNCRVAEDTIGGVYVSTVFLGINHAFRDDVPPVLFETMIFGGGPLDESQWRYVSWEEAERGHEAACELVPRSQGWWPRL